MILDLPIYKYKSKEIKKLILINIQKISGQNFHRQVV